MVLDVDGTSEVFERSIDGGGSGEVLREFQVIVNQDAIELHCDSWPGGSFALGVECCGGKHDVVSLPAEWW